MTPTDRLPGGIVITTAADGEIASRHLVRAPAWVTGEAMDATTATTMLPTFNETGHLPVGRYGCTPEQAKRLLVDDPQFAGSAARPELWNNLERYLSVFFSLEMEYLAGFPSPLIDRVWIGGSFASSKVEPANIDLTLVVNEEARDLLKGKPGVGFFTRSRDSVKDEYKISPLFLMYRPVVNLFRLDELDEADKRYFASRGRWDDWWQRTRLPNGSQSPSMETVAPRRGYLEVIF